MIQDVVQIFSRENVSISSMEVSPGRIFIKFHLNNRSEIEESLRKTLIKLADVVEIVNIALLPHEQREKELQAVLESANDGIVGLDAQATIRHINSTAAKLLKIDKLESIGKDLQQVLGSETPFLGLLTGKSFDNRELLVDTPRGMLHYLCSGRPIRDENDQVIGAVTTLKSMKSAQQLVNAITKSQPFGFNDIIHASSSMDQVIDIANKVAMNNCTILIRGESGTGKELFARAIHEASSRRDKPFLPINCAALPEALLESELFGYEEGAFSGAKKGGSIGLFETAHHGTLFLDEIGELSLILQGKLLRTIQEGTVRRVGGNRQIPVDVRLLAATNRNLEEMVAAKQFRQDLYYRINVIPLNIPALRQRRDDIPVLLQYFLIKYCSELNKELDFSPEAFRFLLNYEWPGNVRELQNVVLRAVHLTANKMIDTPDLLIHGETNNSNAIPALDGKTLKQTKDDAEKALLEKVLKKCGSARGAAKDLGLSHTAVLKKIHRFGLESLLNK